jgi:hypothetical protein
VRQEAQEIRLQLRHRKEIRAAMAHTPRLIMALAAAAGPLLPDQMVLVLLAAMEALARPQLFPVAA